MSEEDISTWVRSLVLSGECDEDEVATRLTFHIHSDDLDENWLRQVIRDEVAAKRKSEENWPKVTDFDRLDRATIILEAQGSIALHRAGYTLSDGLEDVVAAYQEAGGARSGYAGHCYYTEQDQEGARDGSGLYIGFGHLTRESKGVKVGQIVRAALEAEGFVVHWDGTIESRIFIVGFRWQRRCKE